MNAKGISHRRKRSAPRGPIPSSPRPGSKTNAHAPNESLHAGDFRKLTASLAYLFDNLGNLPEGTALKGTSVLAPQKSE
jgi:hypothetical protein